LDKIAATVIAPSILQREAKRMINGARSHFIVTDESREDRQTCGVS
jgi:hypothetical protein